MKKNLVCALYNHPEAYPPTLNAIGELSKIYDNIYLIYRPNLPDLWDYPENVFLIRSQKKISVNDQASLSAVSKFFLFFHSHLGFCELVINTNHKQFLCMTPWPYSLIISYGKCFHSNILFGIIVMMLLIQHK